MKSCKLFIISAAFLLISFDTASACSCITPENATVALRKSKLAFFGRVVTINNGEVRFSVERYWKRTGRRFITLEIGESSCDMEFALGERYLVYAYNTKVTTYSREGVFISEKNILTTDVCSRTGRLIHVRSDLKELGAGLRPRTGRARRRV